MSEAVSRKTGSQGDASHHSPSSPPRPLRNLAASMNKELPPLPHEHVGPQPAHGDIEGRSRPVPPPKHPQRSMKSPRSKPHHNAAVEPQCAQIGFKNLAPTFHLWSRIKPITGNVTIELGNQPLGPPSYIATLGTSGGKKTTIRDISLGREVANGSEKNPMRSKCTLSVDGFDSEFQKSGTSYYFSAPVRGWIDTFEWRKGRVGKDWTLVSAGSSLEAPPLATWHCKSEYIKKNTELGVFEFHEPAVTGEMGDIFLALAIMALVRIYHKSHETKVAVGGSSAPGNATSSVPVAVA